MIKEIPPKLFTLLKENDDLRELLYFIIKEANFIGQQGKSVNNIVLKEKKKNLLLLRFFNEYFIEWDENS